jgi:HIT domain
MVVYSGEHVLAFLDIQPMTWGHMLVIPRKHRVKMGDLEAVDAAEVSGVYFNSTSMIVSMRECLTVHTILVFNRCWTKA